MSISKSSGRKREQVGGDGRRVLEEVRHTFCRRCPPDLPAVRHGRPASRDVERQPPSRLQVRLIEAGKRQRRAGGHEEGIQELVLPVQGRVAGRELKADVVSASHQATGRKEDVSVLDRRRDGLAVEAD